MLLLQKSVANKFKISLTGKSAYYTALIENSISQLNLTESKNIN